MNKRKRLTLGWAMAILLAMTPLWSLCAYGEVTDSALDGGVLSADLSYTLTDKEGIRPEADNAIKIAVRNRGTMWLKDAEIRLTLPEEIQIYQGSEAEDIGFFSVGDNKTVTFHLTAKREVKAKSYPVSVQISGTDVNGASQSLSRTFYLPVLGKGESEDWSLRDIQIGGISLPQEAAAGESFDLTFTLRNAGEAAAEDLKVTVTPGEGLLNRSVNVFEERTLGAGESRSYRVSLFSMKDAEEKNYPIKITVEDGSPEEAETNTEISQYAGILIVPEEESSEVKTPRLLVEEYSYGGGSVQAGESFSLELRLRNTSGSTLRNIQASISCADGSLIPAGTGNVFFVESIGPKERISHSIPIRAKNDAEEKTTPVDVELSYEDEKGNEFSAKSAVSIPVTQKTRLMIDDVVAPPELYAGMQSWVSVDFYNMGKTVLSNLRVSVRGNFDEPQSNAYYVGNMESGKSDSYDFTFIPRESGALEGVITFQYEDAAGQESVVEKAFQFTVAEEIIWEDPGMIEPEMPEERLSPAKVGAAAGVVVAGVVAGVYMRKRHKKKKEAQLELED